jgi:hypothetical protein
MLKINDTHYKKSENPQKQTKLANPPIKKAKAGSCCVFINLKLSPYKSCKNISGTNAAPLGQKFAADLSLSHKK